MMRWQTAASLAVVMAAAGCGGSVVTSRNEGSSVVTTTTATGFAERVPAGPVIAKLGLPGGGELIIVGERYLHKGKVDYGLGDYTEEPAKYLPGVFGRNLRTKHGMVLGGSGSGGGVEVGFNVRKVLEIISGGSCVGPYPYGFAYGMLHDPKDIVTARTRNGPVVLKKAAIPAGLHADGVLVYALLPPGQNEVVIRTPDGRVVSGEPSAEIEAAVCPKTVS